ncbi:cid1 family poly A polymerase domain-containing protein [Phthorimaea operculella]|nr:cid1 family poly A polymerase domain-containing protein [Phthorimaea operculella]
MSFQDNILDTSKLSLNGDFQAQVNQLLGMVRLTKTEVENLQILIDDVQKTLGARWPGCRMYPFGSIVTGLGITTSDIDCFVQLPSWVRLESKLVYKARAYLQAQPHLFNELTAIPMAKVPIVKFHHIPTRRHCDINFTSMAGVQNSKLIAYLLHVDPRALPLAVLIKYWSKVHNLTGTNLMPNYALTMLVIFYLQHLEILPPVCLLQQNCREFMVENWNSAFNSVPFRAGQNNKLTLYQLLGGFFDYYSSFDFDNLIISTYLGRAIHKSHFQAIEMAPLEFGLYRYNIAQGICKPLRIDTKLCVQDPFEHARNCSVGVHQKLFDMVMKYIKKSAEMFYNEESDRYLKAILTSYKPDGDQLKNIQYLTTNRNALGKVRKPTQRKQNNVDKNIKKNVQLLYDQFRRGGKR